MSQNNITSFSNQAAIDITGNNNIITNNDIRNTAGLGIDLHASAKHNQITSNKIKTTNHAIQLANSDNNTINQNNLTSTNNQTIQIGTALNVTLTNNNITTNHAGLSTVNITDSQNITLIDNNITTRKKMDNNK